MHSLIHQHMAHASAPRPGRPADGEQHDVDRPPGRLRQQSARALAALAGRLDREQARRALA